VQQEECRKQEKKTPPQTFSTFVLISMWKTALLLGLTTRFSVLWSGLHNFCAGSQHSEYCWENILRREKKIPAELFASV
jgi:hypothetical protein